MSMNFQSGPVVFLGVSLVDCVSHILTYIHFAVETMENSVVSTQHISTHITLLMNIVRGYVLMGPCVYRTNDRGYVIFSNAMLPVSRMPRSEITRRRTSVPLL